MTSQWHCPVPSAQFPDTIVFYHSQVRAHYTLFLDDCTLIESSRDNEGEPFEFVTGIGQHSSWSWSSSSPANWSLIGSQRNKSSGMTLSSAVTSPGDLGPAYVFILFFITIVFIIIDHQKLSWGWQSYSYDQAKKLRARRCYVNILTRSEIMMKSHWVIVKDLFPGQVIQGWEVAIPQLSLGQRAAVTLSPGYICSTMWFNMTQFGNFSPQTWPMAKLVQAMVWSPQTQLLYLTLKLSTFSSCDKNDQTLQFFVFFVKNSLFHNLRVGFERSPSSPLRQACLGSSSTASLHSSCMWTWSQTKLSQHQLFQNVTPSIS